MRESSTWHHGKGMQVQARIGRGRIECHQADMNRGYQYAAYEMECVLWFSWANASAPDHGCSRRGRADAAISSRKASELQHTGCLLLLLLLQPSRRTNSSQAGRVRLACVEGTSVTMRVGVCWCVGVQGGG